MESSDQPRLSLPDHTRIQVVALIQAVIAVVIAFGVPITQEQSVALVALAGVLGTVLIAADASIRRERARNADKLLPRASVERTTMDAEGETTVRVDAPMAEAAADAELDEEILDLLRRIIRARETAANGASNGKAEKPARARAAAPRRRAARTRG